MDFVLPNKYDGLNGRPVRELKLNDVVNINTTGGTLGAVGGTLAFTTITANQVLYITNIYATTTATITLTVQSTGTNVMGFWGQFSSEHPLKMEGSRESPLLKISGASTISVAAVNGSTAAIMMTGVREPNFSSIETV